MGESFSFVEREISNEQNFSRGSRWWLKLYDLAVL